MNFSESKSLSTPYDNPNSQMDIYGQKVFVFHFIFRKMEAILFIILQIFLQITVKKSVYKKLTV